MGNSTAEIRRIALFSDGTGNSSAKLFKTNVWRMYEAVDLGPSNRGHAMQIAYYDNGVGTQQIRILALLAGLFGIGLKRNVLRLYRFACRNGGADTEFFCFGFSRGAYTIRLVASMLAKYGLVDYDSEAELNARSQDVFREFMRDNNPNVFQRVGDVARWVRDRLIRLKRAVLGPHLQPRPPIKANVRFLGVWDTVAAYGGPITEITRGIDDYLYPLTMTDSCLHREIGDARHALAIDDERDAFQPVLWDEVDWLRKAQVAHPDDPEAQQQFRDRLQQVWFAGMHADVGGGYPDESLSYVSLCWMMDEAEDAGLRLLPLVKLRIRKLANSLGPIHDSRGGLGAYYRPQPRKIAAFLHPDSGMDLETATLALRDPVLGELPKPPHGVLLGCAVHESVVTRLVTGTDDYAPGILPPEISIVPYTRSAVGSGGNPVVSDALRRRLSQRDDAWYARQERIWDFVLWRRVSYFAAVVCTGCLVLLPWWPGAGFEDDMQAARQQAARLLSPVHSIIPGWAARWLTAIVDHQLVFVILLIGALAFSVIGGWLHDAAHDRSRALWKARIAGGDFSAFPRPGRLTQWRNSGVYQQSLQTLKWRVGPALAASLLLSVATLGGLAAITQARWTRYEPTACDDVEAKSVGSGFEFDTRSPCVALTEYVRRGHRYEIAFAIKPGDEWHDGSLDADPTGVLPDQSFVEKPVGWARQWLLALNRRIVDADPMQPIYEVRPLKSLGHPIVRMLNVERDDTPKKDPPKPDDPTVWTGILIAPESGELFLFLNDTPFRGPLAQAYADNRGRAAVVVRDLDAAQDETELQ